MGYNKPELRKRIVAEVKASSQGGTAGQWSARKAQIANQKYEKAGGGYTGPKSAKQRSLSKWTKEEWRTKSGKPSTQGPSATGERYLPTKAINDLRATDTHEPELLLRAADALDALGLFPEDTNDE